MYADWTAVGRGVTNYLSAPDLPMDTKGTNFLMPGGYIANGDISTYKPIKSFDDPYFRDGVAESVKHAWYKGGKGALHPYKGETNPEYTDFQDDGKYSWVKAPTFYGKPAQVGPLANVLCGVAAGDPLTVKYATAALDMVSKVAGAKVGVDALHSTIGRHAARAIRCGVIMHALEKNWQALVDNIAKGDIKTFNRPTFPKGEITGYGFHEAPRGILSHWTVIRDGKIANYQCVVPTTWNAAPRNEEDAIGPYEAALLGTPVANPELPLEILRTIHSFDPCLACAVHIVDGKKRSIVQVKAL
jgi:hydrogenase large subunit